MRWHAAYTSFMKITLLTSIIGMSLLFASCTTQSETGMNHDTHDSSMTMDDMVSMLKGKTGDELDKAFLEGMIPHHQGAIDMANLVLNNAKHEEIKQMARDIISAQQREIDMMKQWQKNWGYTQ